MLLTHLYTLTALVFSTSTALALVAPRRFEPLGPVFPLDQLRPALLTRATICRSTLILYNGECIQPNRCPSGTFGNLQTRRPSSTTPDPALEPVLKEPWFLLPSLALASTATRSFRTRQAALLQQPHHGKLFKISRPVVEWKRLIPPLLRLSRSGRVLRNGACVAIPTCTGATFLDATANACVPCLDANALTCAKDGKSKTCKVNYALVGTACTRTTCATGEYLEDGVCNKCSVRFPGSLTCTKDAAVTCSSNTFFNTGACVTACPSKTYPKSRVCTACRDPDALACTESGPTSCGVKFLRADATCGNCPAGYYADETNRVCVVCPAANAATCSGTTTLSCVTGYTLVAGTCELTPTCANSQYYDFRLNRCVRCSELDPQAATCLFDIGVTSCNPDHVLRITPTSRRCLGRFPFSLTRGHGLGYFASHPLRGIFKRMTFSDCLAATVFADPTEPALEYEVNTSGAFGGLGNCVFIRYNDQLVVPGGPVPFAVTQQANHVALVKGSCTSPYFDTLDYGDTALASCLSVELLGDQCFLAGTNTPCPPSF